MIEQPDWTKPAEPCDEWCKAREVCAGAVGSILAYADHGIVQTIGEWSAELARLTPHVEAPPDFMPDKLTPSTPAEVFDAFGSADATLTRAARLVMLSQWCLETGGGHSCHRFNLGNVKHVRGDAHRWTAFHCTEVLGGRVVAFDPPDPQTWFRAFETLTDGTADYLDMMRRRFVRAWPSALAGDVEGFGHILKLERYYTADEHAYVALLRRLHEELERQIP